MHERIYTHISKQELATLPKDSAFAKRVRCIFTETKNAYWDDYIERAQATHHRDGEIEIDDDACVSVSDDHGAYVQAWIWVADRECPECSEPVRHGEECTCNLSPTDER